LKISPIMLSGILYPALMPNLGIDVYPNRKALLTTCRCHRFLDHLKIGI
jgi:hypothetical protein